MSHATLRILPLLCVVALLAAVGVAGSAATARESSAGRLAVPIPCDPVIDRTITPLVVEEGGQVRVHVHYNYSCTGQSRKVNFFLLVENTSALRPGGRLTMLNNLKIGLKNLVNQVDFANGSQGGLTLYSSDYQNRVTLQSGEQARENLLQAISLISVEPSGEAAGVTGAVRDATERLPTGVSQDVSNVLIIVDAGATIPATGPTMSKLQDSCEAADAAGVYMYLVGLPAAGNRLSSVGCSHRYRGSGATDGSDLPRIFNEVAEELFKGKQAGSSEYYDHINAKFQFVPGSAVPKAPLNPIGSEFSWQFLPPGPGGQVIEYSANVAPDVKNEMAALSYTSELALFYQDGSSSAIPAPNPQICIYERGDPSFCAGAIATLTAMVPTNTPGPTTPVPPTDTPTVTPTAPLVTDTPTPTYAPPPTEKPPRHEVYLPALLNKGDFGGG